MNFKNQLMAGLGLMLLHVSVMAQNNSEQDQEGSKERTQVVCHAVADRWVCTPSGSDTSTAVNAPIQPATERLPETPSHSMEPPPGVESVTDTVPETPITKPASEVSEADLTPELSEPISTVQESLVTSDSTTVRPDYVGDNWFQRYPTHWTVQIVGVANQQNLDTFIKQQQLNDQDYRIVETVSKGAPWWVVIYGHYPNRDAADMARQNLPENLAIDAWLRPLSSIAGDD